MNTPFKTRVYCVILRHDAHWERWNTTLSYLLPIHLLTYLPLDSKSIYIFCFVSIIKPIFHNSVQYEVSDHPSTMPANHLNHLQSIHVETILHHGYSLKRHHMVARQSWRLLYQ